MPSEFGKKIITRIFGESHAEYIGVTVDGLPEGESIDVDELLRFSDRRRPGKSELATRRNEADTPIFKSGIENGRLTGERLEAVIYNTDKKSSDYDELRDKPRPGHADYTAYVKWGGKQDMRGGGKFSGRLTAPLCIAGGIAKQLLEKRNIFIGAHIAEIAGIADRSFELFPEKELFDVLAEKEIAVIDDNTGEKMRKAITEAAAEGDSVGGIIECCAIGLPVGLGDSLFDGLEGRISYALFGIPAVKGVEFGAGFSSSRLKGSENNDGFLVSESGKIITSTNNCGGILGGISNGMPLIVRAAFKPTPSISKEQNTVSISRNENTVLKIKGRHDPCVVTRAVPVVEAVVALALLDVISEENNEQ